MEDQKQPEPIKFIWAKPKEPTPQIYSNYVHLSWTLVDVRFQLGQLVPVDTEPDSKFVVEERGAVTLAWPQIKSLRDMLIDVVKRYEETNGEINLLKLPANTPRADTKT